MYFFVTFTALFPHKKSTFVFFNSFGIHAFGVCWLRDIDLLKIKTN